MRIKINFILFFGLSFSLLVFSFASASWYGPAGSGGPPYCTSPTNPNDPDLPNPCSLPINTSNAGQIKGDGTTGKGGLGINGILGGFNIFTKKLGVSLGANPLDLTAVLDVNGPINLRYGCPLGAGCLNKVLGSSNTDGLATWIDSPPPINDLRPGRAITLTPTPGKPSEITVAMTAGVQQRITGTCPLNEAISEVKEDGTVTCRRLVSDIATPVTGGGLTITGSGAKVLSVNTTSGGLSVSGNILRVTPPVSGSGLVVSGNYLQFATSTNTSPVCSGANVYWKYTTANGWNCSPPKSSLTNGATLYLTADSPGTPFPCPDGWTNLTTPAVMTESTGTSANSVRRCWRSDKVCTVLYFKKKAFSPGTLPACPLPATVWGNSSPFSNGWFTRPGNVYYEYVYNATINEVRACFSCP